MQASEFQRNWSHTAACYLAQEGIVESSIPPCRSQLKSKVFLQSRSSLSTATTYTTFDNKQYVVMVVGGHGSVGTKPGDCDCLYAAVNDHAGRCFVLEAVRGKGRWSDSTLGGSKSLHAAALVTDLEPCRPSRSRGALNRRRASLAHEHYCRGILDSQENSESPATPALS
jgi:hypothetical protein